jgi:hypothetical protein
MLGADTDSERAIRWLIAHTIPRCDPLAIIDGCGVGTTINETTLVRSTLHSCRADAIEDSQRLWADSGRCFHMGTWRMLK